MKLQIRRLNRQSLMLLFGTLVFVLCGQLDAALLSYHWQYVGPSGVLVKGGLSAQGIDECGYLENISDVSMGVIGGRGIIGTGILDVEDVGGWFFSEPRIRADGSSQGLDLSFVTPYNDANFAFVMHDHSEFDGPFEGEVIFRDTNDHFRFLEDISFHGINWSLWHVEAGTPIPDGGMGLICVGATLGGLCLLRRAVR